MKVLIICSHKCHLPTHVAPFIQEQVEALSQTGIECSYFLVKGKGIRGYINELPRLKQTIRAFRPDIIHAHYGLCGLLANLQHSVPVVTTYHGSDINEPGSRFFSLFSIVLSRHNIFVSKKLKSKVVPLRCWPNRRCTIIPCGINPCDYPLATREEARAELGLEDSKRYILFAGAFDNAVKNAPLAQAAVRLLSDAELSELKGYTRTQVALLMRAVDSILMTSHSEGSPQVIKEALYCGCPIVSVDVGDVKEMTYGIQGCYITDRTPAALAKALEESFRFHAYTCGKEHIIDNGLDNPTIAQKITDIYAHIIQP